jgi:hypothetical protein
MSDKNITAGYFAANLAPMLAPNKCLGIDIPLNTILWPMLLSTKFNGIRGTTAGGQWRSRTGKPVRMAEHIATMLQPILDYSVENRVVLDGEFNSNSHNTVGQTMSILAGTVPCPPDFQFKCFYEMPCDIWNTKVKAPMSDVIPMADPGIPRLYMVPQLMIHSTGEFENYVDKYKTRGIEGFMLLAPGAYYKHHSRTTIREQILLKYKYYSDKEDGKVIGLVPRMERRADAEQRQGRNGYSEQYKTKDSHVPTDIAGCMIVKLENGETIHSPFPLDYPLTKRQQIHAHFGTGFAHDIQGAWISFRRLACEDRGKPVAIKGVEFRDSKD